MPELELSDSLKESGIEEIRTLGFHIIIKHKIKLEVLKLKSRKIHTKQANLYSENVANY